ncbi:xenotropic and polytropic retrovirus receptor 1 homolog [Biomphalaria glabrata]|uniref:Xenotropic and polytropic retrovirus receptor 1 homolog n=1 Tax=Biomphalaria glabrata TaxID=6526 RepID=A0A9U8E5C5_BIOGL|nr:xenotropic and polytropic retrovirus receptor 1 homolog [Biomphalaria glabrata]XP_055896781.1 xenotropic and polytropic retrovirus receptor 1 homolog [Biomphalaria glabrata]
MKFAEHLGAHITPEWRKQYIQYEYMKEMLYDAQEQAPSPEVTDTSTIQRYFARFTEKFFQFCEKELSKINTFFLEKLSEANRKYANLKAELEVFLNHHSQQRHTQLRRRKASMANLQLFKDKELKGQAMSSMRKLHDLKLAFSEFYLSLVLLQNYQTLNFTGFRKILKKHDKMMQTTTGSEWRQAHVEASAFYTNKEVDHLIKDVEQSVTSELEGGDRSKAMKRLRVPPLGDEQHPWTNFKMGLCLGMFAVLVIVIIISAIYVDRAEDWEAALHMYRGSFLVIFDLFLLGVNTYGWRSSGVNHVLIFEIDPRNHLTHSQLLELASFLGVIWALSVLSYLYSEYLSIPPMAMPLAFTTFLIVALINPFKIFYYRARMWLLRILFRIVTAPFHHVGFADFWLADQLNSLVTVLLDLEYLICYYSFDVKWLGGDPERESVCSKNVYGIIAIVSSLPAWFRFAQCLRRYRDTKLVFPHIVNAGKYSTTFFVVLFSTLYKVHVEMYGDHYRQASVFFYLWIVSAVISSCYTYTWDIKMDWGLMDKNAGDNRFLREEVVYAYKAYYYFAMIEDFILRFLWTLTVSVGEGLFYNNTVLKTVFASLEVFRRFVWNFFRLENEHLNNCGQFRAVRDISIGPIDSNFEQQLLDIMDSENETDWRLNDKRRRGFRNNKESRLFIDEDDERVPLVNGGKELKRM